MEGKKNKVTLKIEPIWGSLILAVSLHRILYFFFRKGDDP